MKQSDHIGSIFHARYIHTKHADYDNYTIIRLMSVRPSLSGKNWLRDENGKVTMGCGSGWGCHVGLVGM